MRSAAAGELLECSIPCPKWSVGTLGAQEPLAPAKRGPSVARFCLWFICCCYHGDFLKVLCQNGPGSESQQTTQGLRGVCCWPPVLQYVPPDMAVSRPKCRLERLLLVPSKSMSPEKAQVPGESHPPVATIGNQVSGWFLSLWLTTALVVGGGLQIWQGALGPGMPPQPNYH